MFVATHTATSRTAAYGSRPQPEPYDDDEGEELVNVTLGEALTSTMRERWAGLRSSGTLFSQAHRAALTLGAVVLYDEMRQPTESGDGTVLGSIRVADITARHVTFIINCWRAEGLSAATINKRLNCLSVMGVEAAGRRVKKPRVLKWWLKPDVEEALVKRLAAEGEQLMADYITWTTHTGLRVEESLALTRAAFSVDDTAGVSVTVPGTKTRGSHATLPLGEEAAAVFWSRFANVTEPSARMFPVTYTTLMYRWNLCRAMIGAADDPMATLKALRRSAARYLHVVKGMPLDLVRNYLRHNNILITMEYLRLTGGYGTEEYRKWL